MQYLQDCHFLVTLISLQKVCLCFEFAQNNSLYQFYCKGNFVFLQPALQRCLQLLIYYLFAWPWSFLVLFIWVLCVPWSMASMFYPHCVDGSKILLLVDRVTYWLGSRLQRYAHGKTSFITLKIISGYSWEGSFLI